MHAQRRDDMPKKQPMEPRRTPQSSSTSSSARAIRATPAGLLAQQPRAGNAAVVQMLRRAGHGHGPGSDEEQHQHGPDRRHQPTEQQAVQRSAVHDVLRRSGRPLDDTLRGEMEARLGADFSDVRIHNDHAARASAKDIGARAYTSGSHIVVGHGGTDKHTLAHELTHVIQQRQGPVSGTDNGNGLAVSDPADQFERAAEANASRVMAGPLPDVQRAHSEGPLARGGTAGLPAVQRYAPGALTGVVGERRDVEGGGQGVDHFVTQAPDAVLRPGKSPNKLIGHEIDHMDVRRHHPGDVSLMISDDGTLAVHDTEREPKEFYASSEVFTQSVADLAARNSAYTLVRSGGAIRTAGGPLERITPVLSGEEERARAAGFADLIKVQCIDVARKVIGSHAMEIVLQGSSTTETVPWSERQGAEIAERVAKSVREMTGGGADGSGTSVAQQYGTALREHPDEADRAAQELGVNNHVQPDVGEAFATLSIGSDAKVDYATAAAGEASTDRGAVDVWNYHFAGVVARSRDGNDWVTLENYTRDQQAQKALHELEGKLLAEYRKKTTGWIFNREGKTPKGTFESDRIVTMIQELANVTRAKAQAEYMALGMAKEAWKSKWFFRMYGSGAGQRFHEKQYNAGQGDFVNPLTVRTRTPRPESGGSG
ncbi:eCIS core domain-containing protein [Streptomyces gossypiisoli]|uniref:eCIS core domain-containing protein n=1 Tax=Streptomyces gossypiisoli TaxID=2748864 RepID=UPI001E5C6EFA|nr:DUF4157 domain-containing protein [Streptomyces gossypiisoli]